MGYDIIGDIHGQYEKLIILLEKLGYELIDGVYRHPFRIAIFAGDFIDRGALQLRTLIIIQRMVAAGSALAVMGNHEFNAIAFFLCDPASAGRYLRPRTDKNISQHNAFLLEVVCDSHQHQEIVAWFLSLPLWIDLPGLRVVHACWDQRSIDILSASINPGNLLDVDLVEQASREDTELFKAVEVILKGPEVSLPLGSSYFDSDGHERTKARARWWDSSALSLKEVAMVNSRVAANLPAIEIPSAERVVYDNKKPLFIGHYWMSGHPRLLSGKIACVDYSAARNGDLMAYRWTGEDILDERNFYSSGMDLSLF